ncbi:DUF4169 family protein [Shimia marina]|uniref:DUF4169 domain-containing protein n=1 Tax=Shimia marina TaxID=321267 RepID=A0A0N7LSH4_9RHOB|nr:DUF4169 family protein [Shimia marina]CUH53628.1 hypothetical protein SHM7688_03083 [Shimia marina]SFD72537.1 protein of unknown function [Shimia marina]
MADIINLNTFRKSKARATQKAQADENAVKFGRTKAQKQKEAKEAAKAKHILDGKERDTPPT